MPALRMLGLVVGCLIVSPPSVAGAQPGPTGAESAEAPPESADPEPSPEPPDAQEPGEAVGASPSATEEAVGGAADRPPAPGGADAVASTGEPPDATGGRGAVGSTEEPPDAAGERQPPIDEWNEPFEDPVREVDEPSEEPLGAEREEGEGQEEGAVGEAHVVRYYLEGYEVLGADSTRRETVLRHMLLAEGETFRADDPRIERSRVALLATGFFEDVRFSVRRGSRRGWVIFRVHVRERWTIVVENLSLGYTDITPYGGFGITEMNLAGTGSRLGGAFVVGDEQQAYRLRFVDPNVLDSPWSLTAGILFNGAQDYLGFTDVYAVRPNGDEERDHATIDYWRAGGTFGTGRALPGRLRVDVGYRFEWIEADLPLSASYQRGGLTNPVPLDLVPGRSILSVLAAGVAYDGRDDPFLPSSGTLFRLTADVGSEVFGSDYSYAKFAIEHATHWRLPWGHTVKVETFAGLILGEAPLYEQFYVGDLSDLIPARVLDLNFHNYPAYDLLGTAIAEMQYEDIAARVGAEYAMPLHRSRTGFLYGCDVFLSFGLYVLASAKDVALQVPGYDGAAVFPVDITADFGFRFDTMIGLFRLSLSNVIGLIPRLD